MNIAPGISPRVSFVPVVMQAIENGGAEVEVREFVDALGPALTRRLLENWRRMPLAERMRRFPTGRGAAPVAGGFARQMQATSANWVAARTQLLIQRKRLIKMEVDRAILEGPGRYVPSETVRRDRALAYEVLRKLHAKLAGCRCEEDNPEPPAEPTPRFGLKVSKLKCLDQREVGNDEIYLVSVAVDGNGRLIATTSPKYSIDDDDDDVRYPNLWIYPMQDPKGFLDVAVSMWEDDGGYAEAGATVTSIGAAVSKIPSPYTLAAGVALQVIGGLMSLASFLDDDDHYGDAYRTWPNQSSLIAGVGTYNMSYYEVDTGWSDDGHDFDVQLKLLSA